ncbi:hypothetical protein C8R45DRAFT_1025228 [Mycena sanguinolenta]|nr:hypothetical protein C8R45DRAFT_1025228 [Mycena sanguinolenta]
MGISRGTRAETASSASPTLEVGDTATARGKKHVRPYTKPTTFSRCAGHETTASVRRAQHNTPSRQTTADPTQSSVRSRTRPARPCPSRHEGGNVAPRTKRSGCATGAGRRGSEVLLGILWLNVRMWRVKTRGKQQAGGERGVDIRWRKREVKASTGKVNYECAPEAERTWRSVRRRRTCALRRGARLRQLPCADLLSGEQIARTSVV